LLVICVGSIFWLCPTMMNRKWNAPCILYIFATHHACTLWFLSPWFESFSWRLFKKRHHTLLRN